jgi:hypothetical protein
MNSSGVAQQILENYSPELLRGKNKIFNWGNTDEIDSIEKRSNLELKTKELITNKNYEGYRFVLEEIYAWGFRGRKPPTSTLSDEFKSAFISMLHAWSNPEALKHSKLESLEKILAFKNIGIATASKWICFIDQSNYAIYDSRVSIALSIIKDEKGMRIFPIIGRRSTKFKKYPAQDPKASNSHAMAQSYLFYLETLGFISKETTLTASQIEMALFMIGE